MRAANLDDVEKETAIQRFNPRRARCARRTPADGETRALTFVSIHAARDARGELAELIIYNSALSFQSTPRAMRAANLRIHLIITRLALFQSTPRAMRAANCCRDRSRQ